MDKDALTYKRVNTIAGLATGSKSAYLVGGTVRDMVMGRLLRDIDLAVSGDASGLARRIADALGGTAFVMDPGRDAHRVAVAGTGLQVDVSPVKADIYADLAERDFTVNAMALDMSAIADRAPVRTDIIDPFGGLEDIDRHIIRAVGESAFEADPLRVLRSFRLAHELNFTLDEKTLEMTTRHAGELTRVSQERVRDEVYIMLGLPDSAAVFRSMQSAGILAVILPETSDMAGLAQGAPHVHDLLEHSLWAMEYAERVMDGLEACFGEHSGEVRRYLDERVDGPLDVRGLVKLCALLHDSGKPQTVRDEGDRVRFTGHDAAGAGVNMAAARRLRMSSKAAGILATATGMHMRPLHLSKDRHSMRAVHRLVRDAGDALPAVLIVSMADALSTRGADAATETDVEGVARDVASYYYGEYRRAKAAPLVSGNELMEALGIPSGPLVGRLLAEIEERRAEGTVADKEGALEFARGVYVGGGGNSG